MPSSEAMLRAAEAALAERWGPVRLGSPQTLAGSDRATVLRARVTGGPGAAPTVVVKSHHAERAPEAAVREAAALSMLSGRGLPAPELLATARDPALVVLSDLGRAESLADRLLGRDEEAAAEGLSAWAEALASLQAATAGGAEEFGRHLGEQARRLSPEEVVAPAPDSSQPGTRQPGELAVPDADSTPAMLEDSRNRLVEWLPRLLGIEPPGEALEELAALAGLLPGAGAECALTPADACPDNNALLHGGAVLFDFEEATVRHVAWDAAYLTVPWPSCWCSWGLPEGVARPVLGRWRAIAGAALPRVATPAFDEDLRAARTGWAVLSLSWYLRRAAREGRRRRARGHSSRSAHEPRASALLQHRLASVLDDPDPRLPALRGLCEAALAGARREWGVELLAPAPAFGG